MNILPESYKTFIKPVAGGIAMYGISNFLYKRTGNNFLTGAVVGTGLLLANIGAPYLPTLPAVPNMAFINGKTLVLRIEEVLLAEALGYTFYKFVAKAPTNYFEQKDFMVATVAAIFFADLVGEEIADILCKNQSLNPFAALSESHSDSHKSSTRH